MTSQINFENNLLFQEVGGQILLQCEGSANPPPKFEWLQKLTKVVDKTKVDENVDEMNVGENDDKDDDDVNENVEERHKRAEEKIYLRGKEKFIEFRNISYEQEGEWVCVASNIIKGKTFFPFSFLVFRNLIK